MAKPMNADIDGLYDTVFVDDGFDPRGDTLHDRNWIEDEVFFYRFANRGDKTNCLIKVDKDQT